MNSEPEQIWVGVRLRPLNEAEKRSCDSSNWHVTSETSLKQCEQVSQTPGSLKIYNFDRVFSPDTNSRTVYNDAAERIVISGMQGINGTIFAYGQTSSGKTHTMKSIVSLGTKSVFEHIRNTPSRDFLLHIAAIEIYNEDCRDLLKNNGPSLRLLDDPERGTVAEGLTEEPVRSLEHFLQLVAEVENRRQVGSHTLNKTSSRSHQIIRITIESRPASTAEGEADGSGPLVSHLNFVDLAGSERYSETGASGQRLKEGSHINQSLLALGKVIRVLTEGKSGAAHVPYRDSKLTRILQHSLGGNARTAIVCTISPAIEHLHQSKKTLGFASAAQRVTNCAKVNKVQEGNMSIEEYRAENHTLQEALQRARGRTAGPDVEELKAERDAAVAAKVAAQESRVALAEESARLEEALQEQERTLAQTVAALDVERVHVRSATDSRIRLEELVAEKEAATQEAEAAWNYHRSRLEALLEMKEAVAKQDERAWAEERVQLEELVEEKEEAIREANSTLAVERWRLDSLAAERDAAVVEKDELEAEWSREKLRLEDLVRERDAAAAKKDEMLEQTEAEWSQERSRLEVLVCERDAAAASTDDALQEVKAEWSQEKLRLEDLKKLRLEDLKKLRLEDLVRERDAAAAKKDEMLEQAEAEWSQEKLRLEELVRSLRDAAAAKNDDAFEEVKAEWSRERCRLEDLVHEMGVAVANKDKILEQAEAEWLHQRSRLEGLVRKAARLPDLPWRTERPSLRERSNLETQEPERCATSEASDEGAAARREDGAPVESPEVQHPVAVDDGAAREEASSWKAHKATPDHDASQLNCGARDGQKGAEHAKHAEEAVNIPADSEGQAAAMDEINHDTVPCSPADENRVLPRDTGEEPCSAVATPVSQDPYGLPAIHTPIHTAQGATPRARAARSGSRKNVPSRAGKQWSMAEFAELCLGVRKRLGETGAELADDCKAEWWKPVAEGILRENPDASRQGAVELQQRVQEWPTPQRPTKLAERLKAKWTKRKRGTSEQSPCPGCDSLEFPSAMRAKSSIWQRASRQGISVARMWHSFCADHSKLIMAEGTSSTGEQDMAQADETMSCDDPAMSGKLLEAHPLMARGSPKRKLARTMMSPLADRPVNTMRHNETETYTKMKTKRKLGNCTAIA
ncbi:hypothetical protein CYMTET_49022 [Cymbomonas tetramitiformis]|uniref:Kinesin motor domain-containing protein n=1 Tax=Cymbomonas tetramitiformis TaxID=36881 RepID=A0AAE0BSA5_9CHLO|nr:hypothetical protein CYMTET_49022 [Cymbomonas tetramitiformis]